MRTIRLDISETTHRYFENYRKGRKQQIKVLEAFPELRQKTLQSLKGIFKRSELLYLFDMRENTTLDVNYMAIDYLVLEITDSNAIENLSEKYKIDPDDLIEIVQSQLSSFQCFIFLDWIQYYYDKNLSLDEYIDILV